MKQILYIAIGIFLGVMALFIVWSIHNMIMQTNTNTANITTLINNAKVK
jgi:hypothetical protein